MTHARGGRAGEMAADGLSDTYRRLGFEIRRELVVLWRRPT